MGLQVWTLVIIQSPWPHKEDMAWILYFPAIAWQLGTSVSHCCNVQSTLSISNIKLNRMQGQLTLSGTGKIFSQSQSLTHFGWQEINEHFNTTVVAVNEHRKARQLDDPRCTVCYSSEIETRNCIAAPPAVLRVWLRVWRCKNISRSKF